MNSMGEDEKLRYKKLAHSFYKMFYELTSLAEQLKSMSEGAKAKSEEKNDYQDGRAQGYEQSAKRIEDILEEFT